MGVGIMASGVASTGTVIPGAILTEPFNNLANWSTVTGTPAITTGRTGSGLRFSAAGTISWTIPAVSENATVMMGFAYRISALESGRIFELRSDTGATLHTSLAINADGSASAIRSTSIQLATSATGLFTTGTWYYIEIEYKLGDAGVGTWQVRRNGSNILSLTTGDTKNAGTKTVYDQIRLLGSAGTNRDFDDLYVKVGAGQSFAGDTAIT